MGYPRFHGVIKHHTWLLDPSPRARHGLNKLNMCRRIVAVLGLLLCILGTELRFDLLQPRPIAGILADVDEHLLHRILGDGVLSVNEQKMAHSIAFRGKPMDLRW
jgi:hypothetical protein